MNAPLRRLAVVSLALFALLLGSATWVQFVDAGDLQADSRNSRTILAELGRHRGPISASDGTVLAQSVPAEGPYAFQRTYPGGSDWAHVTGYFSTVYGASGIELAENRLLSGTSDQLFYRRVSDLLTGADPAGASVELTLDPEVQQAAEDALGDRTGAVVALDPSTGRVLAMVSRPTYDPDRLAGLDRSDVVAAWEDLTSDPDRPLVNRAVGGDLYPPGSVFKLVTAAAALESGSYTPDSVLDAPDVLDLPQTDADLPNAGGESCSPTGEASLADALRVSCNTAFGSLGLALGGQALRDQAEAFGFGRDLSIPLPVTPSSVPEDLTPPQVAQSAIGQYDVRVTPLQVAMVAAAIANDGVVMEPQMISAVRDADLSVIERPEPREIGRAVSEETADELTQMMELVVDEGTGTAAQIPGVDVAGKTGTAEHGDGSEDTHAWFASFAPADDPQVAVAVLVENGGSGGGTAAPVARQVMEAVVD